MAVNASVIEELVVRLRMDTTSYEKSEKGVEKRIDQTDRKLKKADDARMKRTKEGTAGARAFTASLRGLSAAMTTIASVASLAATGVAAAVVSLNGFETGLRRQGVATQLSNRELQSWGSAAKRLGADAESGRAAIAALAREQKQFSLTGQAPTMAALSKMGVNVGPNTPVVDMLEQAQRVYRNSSKAQQGQIEASLSASGMDSDLILMIRSERDVRAEYTKSYAQSATENRRALDAVSDAMEAVKASTLNVANAIATVLLPVIESFAAWTGKGAARISEFVDRVIAAGGGLDGFMKVLDTDAPIVSTILRELGSALGVLGEAVDLSARGLQLMKEAAMRLVDWIMSILPAGVRAKIGEVSGAVSSTAASAWNWTKNAWHEGVVEARRLGPAPVAALLGNSTGASAGTSAAAGSSGSAPGARAKPGERPTQDQVMRHLIDGGMTVAQAAGIAANIKAESGFDPTAYNDKGGGQGARGLMQWRGARIAAFEARYGVKPDKADWRTQLDFLKADPYEAKLLAKSLQGGGSAYENGERVSRIFEAHGNAAADIQRATLAAKYAREYRPAGGGAGAAAGVDGTVIQIQNVTVQANDAQTFTGSLKRAAGAVPYNSAVR